jgi:cell division septal protein FtsQ
VEVRRDWPATIVVELTERRSVAAVAAGEDRWQVIDADGRVVAVVDELPPELVLLADVAPAGGPGERVAGADAHLAVAVALPDELRDRMRAVRTSDAGDLLLDLAPEGRARLGAPDDLEQKLAALVVVLDQVDLRCLSVVDVRVPTAPTVRRVEECAAPPTTTTTLWVDPSATVPGTATTATTGTAPATTTTTVWTAPTSTPTAPTTTVWTPPTSPANP